MTEKSIPRANPGASTGPHLVAALLCEAVLDEATGVKSLIRIIDRMNVAGPGKQMPLINWHGFLFVTFRTGSARGSVPIKITVTKPSGIEEPNPLYDADIHFEAEARGNNIITELNMQLGEPGLYWFNVYVDDVFVTRTNIDVVWTSQRAGGVARRS